MSDNGVYDNLGDAKHQLNQGGDVVCACPLLIPRKNGAARILYFLIFTRFQNRRFLHECSRWSKKAMGLVLPTLRKPCASAERRLSG